MTSEELILSDFLIQNGWGKAHRQRLASDASFRIYERLTNKKGETAILMNAPKSENPDQFILVDSLLQRISVCAPSVLASDPKNGLILLEDFGDNTFSQLLRQGADEENLYTQAVDTLIKIQKNAFSSDLGIPVYDTKKMTDEVSLLPDWFCRYVLPKPLSPEAHTMFINIWSPIIKKIQELPKSLVLLDYHVDNLMITPDKRCGVLDFQDARMGPVIYDLMSLLEDERRIVPSTLRNKMIERYFRAFPENDTPFVRMCLSLTAMQRHTKVIGIFTRLYVRDGKEKYLKMIPFVWSLIESHLNEDMFHPYRDWIEKYIPSVYRQNIPEVRK